ncbi:PAS domain-containing protein [Roseospira visakhapatnamensis]|uniref:histidine kinase n=1 Tax=Roseospira visakhapatnamensis TaxID=390880 RepID=A0A7W6RGJ2_9PROT|nr:PAS domain-containing protein [Roseospira visakhapatnamensis]MBB4268042.1 PAS domain S-box-containing protein [Roseospira visakhapatnamensis]
MRDQPLGKTVSGLVSASRCGSVPSCPDTTATATRQPVSATRAREALLLTCLDLPGLAPLFEDLRAVTGLSVTLLDRQGRVLTTSRCQRLCTALLRPHPTAGCVCTRHDIALAQRLEADAASFTAPCPHGLNDAVTRVDIDGLHVATLKAGPFLPGPADRDHFDALRRRHDLAEAAFREALDELPVIDAARLPAILSLMESLARQIATQASAELRARDATTRAETLAADRSVDVRHLQDRLIRLAAHVPGVIYQYRLFADGRSCFPYASDGMREVYGIGPADVRDDAGPVFAALHPDDAARIRESILTSARTGAVWHEQYRARHPTKGIIWLDGRATPERLADDSVLWHGVIVDVTGQMETERCLRDIQNRYRLVTLAVRDGTWEFDLRSGQGHVDDRFQDMLGYPPSQHDMTVDEWLSAVHPDDVHAVRASIRAQWMVGETVQIEYRHRTAHGGWTWIESRGRVLERDCGWPVRLVGTNRDISDRKAIEAALQESEARFRGLFENAPMAYVALDSAGRIVDLNAPLCQMLGRPRAEIVGQVFGAFLAQHGRPTGIKRLARILRDDQADIVLDLQPIDGAMVTVHMVGQVQRDDDGAFLRAHCVLHDITDHARLEARLAQSNADLSQFAYAVSHDLREPLRMVSGFLGLIEHRMGPAVDSELAEFLGFAIDGARRMDRMILDLLDYSRVGRDGDEAGPVGLADVVAEALANLSATIAERGARIGTAPDLPTISGRRSDLVRLFQNLIGNAVKFVPADRRPRIAIRCREAGAAHWRITVADNGTGVPPEMRDRVFGVFERLVAENEVSGTGVGLALCRKIIERHGGDIWFADADDDALGTQAGTGAVVHLLLPKQSADGADDATVVRDRVTLLETLNTHQVRIVARLKNLSDTIAHRQADRTTVDGEIEFLIREVECYRVFVHANADGIFGFGLSRDDQDPRADADSLVFSVHQLHRTVEDQDPCTPAGQQSIGRTLSALLGHVRRSHAWLQRRRDDRLLKHGIAGAAHGPVSDPPA